MKKADPLRLERLKHGSLRLRLINTPSGSYRMGQYVHPLGIVTVYSESRVTVVTAFHRGCLYSRQRTDHPSDGQISHFCRSLLGELNEFTTGSTP